MYKSKVSSGFTIVELVVVIAVIAILATVGVVSYFAAVESGDESKLQAEFNDIRNAIELREAQRGSYPECPSGSVECDLSEVTSQLGVEGLQTQDDSGGSIRYIFSNDASNKGWGIRMYRIDKEEYCKVGSNMHSSWWTGYEECW